MTTYGHDLSHLTWLHGTAQRVWAIVAVLVLAGITTLIVVLSTRGSEHARPAAPAPVQTVQQHAKTAAADCRPTNVVQPC